MYMPEDDVVLIVLLVSIIYHLILFAVFMNSFICSLSILMRFCFQIFDIHFSAELFFKALFMFKQGTFHEYGTLWCPVTFCN